VVGGPAVITGPGDGIAPGEDHLCRGRQQWWTWAWSGVGEGPVWAEQGGSRGRGLWAQLLLLTSYSLMFFVLFEQLQITEYLLIPPKLKSY
jgi:hypothetical protein